MSDSGWTTQKRKRDTRQYIREREADALEAKHNIIGLSRALISKESRRLQDEGWRFECVIRGNNDFDQNLDTNFDFMKRLPIEGNKYGDEMLFVKVVE